jgi:thymidylate synthase
MQNYLDLMKDVMENGVDRPDRTGIGSRFVNGRILRWDLKQGFPIITTRKVSLRIAFEETMFFLRGQSDTKLLEEKNINIWRGNTSREFLDARGLTNLPEGDMGRGYGVQWRNWRSSNDCEVDQISQLLENIKTDPHGRRHVVTGWNPGELNQMALPPCHMMHMYSVEGEFTVTSGRLNSCFVMRSNDVPYGLPYNIMSYALLNHIFAKHLGLEPGDLVYMGWDVHIYNNQFDMVREQLTRTPTTLPELYIDREVSTIDDIMALDWADIRLEGYNPMPDIQNKPKMAV